MPTMTTDSIDELLASIMPPGKPGPPGDAPDTEPDDDEEEETT